jgi:hypothetical protein
MAFQASRSLRKMSAVVSSAMVADKNEAEGTASVESM